MKTASTLYDFRWVNCENKTRFKINLISNSQENSESIIFSHVSHGGLMGWFQYAYNVHKL